MTRRTLLSTGGFLFASLAIRRLWKAPLPNLRQDLPKPDILPAKQSRKALGLSTMRSSFSPTGCELCCPRAPCPLSDGERVQSSASLLMMSVPGLGSASSLCSGPDKELGAANGDCPRTALTAASSWSKSPTSSPNLAPRHMGSTGHSPGQAEVEFTKTG